MTSPDDKPISAMFDHCVKVYKAMEERANVEVTTADEGEEETRLVYEGYLTQLFNQLMLSVPYYTSVMNNLKRMSCVEQLRRGGGNAPSRWILLREPTEELYNDTTRNRGKRKPPGGKLEMALQQLRDVSGRVATVEKMLGIGGEE